MNPVQKEKLQGFGGNGGFWFKAQPRCLVVCVFASPAAFCCCITPDLHGMNPLDSSFHGDSSFFPWRCHLIHRGGFELPCCVKKSTLSLSAVVELPLVGGKWEKKQNNGKKMRCEVPLRLGRKSSAKEDSEHQNPPMDVRKETALIHLDKSRSKCLKDPSLKFLWGCGPLHGALAPNQQSKEQKFLCSPPK